MIPVFLVRHRLTIILSLLFVVLRLPSLFEPYWYGDEGIYLTLGQAIRHGEVIYRQIHDNKPPTLYYLAALYPTVFGFRLLLFFWMIPTIYSFYHLSSLFFNRHLNSVLTTIFLVLTSIPLLEGNVANAEIFMLLPTILGLYFFLKHQQYFLSALFLGFAFTIKIPVAIEFMFLFAWLIFMKSKPKIVNIFIFGFGFFVPIFLWGLYFYFHDALPQFIFAAILQNFGYLSSWATGSHFGSATGGGLINRGILLCAVYGLVYLSYRFRKLSINTAFILFWLSATVFGSILSARPYPHYLIQILPPLCLSVGLLLSKRFSIIIAFLCLALVVIKYQFYYYPVFSYYANSYSYLFGLKSLASFRSFFGGHVNDYYQISSYIKNNTSPTDRLFAWGDEPYLYSLSNRLPVGKYTVAYHIIDFNGYNDTISAIKTYLPKYIIIFPMSNRPFPDLERIIKNYYIFDRRYNSVSVYQFRQ